MVDNLEQEFVGIKEKKYTVRDFCEVLEKLCIRKDDVLCVHSQIFSFGKPLVNKPQFLEIIVKALQEKIGKNGILIMPAFSYSFCRKEVFDVGNSPSAVGLLTEYFRNSDDVVRTEHPIFSFSIWGNRKMEYLDIGPDAFSLDSVFGKMLRDNGKIMMLGANKGYTFYHLAEEHVNVGHRYFKNFQGQIVQVDGNKRNIQIPYFVRDLSFKSDLDEEKLSAFLLESGLQKQVLFGKGTVGVFECRNVYKALTDVLRVDEQKFI